MYGFHKYFAPLYFSMSSLLMAHLSKVYPKSGNFVGLIIQKWFKTKNI